MDKEERRRRGDEEEKKKEKPLRNQFRATTFSIYTNNISGENEFEFKISKIRREETQQKQQRRRDKLEFFVIVNDFKHYLTSGNKKSIN